MDSKLFETPFGVDPADPILDLPKVSLHDHLDGGLRPQTIIDLAAEVGHELPATDAEALRTCFSESASSGDLPRYLETFDHTIAVMQTAEGLTRVAREWALDQVADGVFYAEARWAPEQHLQQGLSMDDAVEAVQRGLDEADALAAENGRFIRTGQIITAMRHADNSLAVAELALRHRDRGVVGFDIAGAEDGFPPTNHLAAFELLHRECFPVTIHAGEAAGVDSIHPAVQICHAQRIGHGVRLIEDMHFTGAAAAGDGQLGRLAAWILDNQIPLELCPSSNLQTGAATSIEAHPITRFKELGFAITVNPDNRLMSATSMTREMRLLVDRAGWQQSDLEWATVNALGAAFLPHDARNRFLDDLVIPGFERLDL